MSFKVYEHNGTWILCKESADSILPGVEVGYSEYTELSANPALLEARFERKAGKLLRKPGQGNKLEA